MLIAEANGASVHHADWRDLLPVVEAAGGANAMFADTPYSEKTHKGHDAGVSSVENMAKFALRNGGQEKDRTYAARKAANGVSHRRELNYPPFTPDDVRQYVEAWHPLIRGWFTTITDDVLAPAWQVAFEAVGRYAFAPLPYVAPGSRVRLTGDGPSNWTTWIVVARPRNPEFSRWGTLRGAYILPAGMSADMPVVGGKPPWLLCEMIKDYSRPGDLCIDATCGAGTTGIAAIREDRRAIIGDVNEAHAQLAAQWIREPWRPAPNLDDKPRPGQRSLFGGAA